MIVLKESCFQQLLRKEQSEEGQKRSVPSVSHNSKTNWLLNEPAVTQIASNKQKKGVKLQSVTTGKCTHMHIWTIWCQRARGDGISHYLNQYLQFDKNTETTFRARLNKEQKFGTEAGARLKGETYASCTVSTKLLNWFGCDAPICSGLVHGGVCF